MLVTGATWKTESACSSSSRALERRHEVVDAMWEARDRDEASARLRELLNAEPDVDPLVVIEMQLVRFTTESRDRIHAELVELRELLAST